MDDNVEASNINHMREDRKKSFLSQLRISVRRNPLGIVGGTVLLIILIIAYLGPLVSEINPDEFHTDECILEPCSKHIFGTDVYGRDIFTRVLYGTRISVNCAFAILAGSAFIGAFVGIIAGYFGGIIDEILMRITDIFLSFPPLVLAMVVNAALGSSIIAAVFAVIITWWPTYARMVRGQVLSAKKALYVTAAKSIGIKHGTIMVRHILPNCINPMIVQLTLDAGYVILTLAGLSFIGLGAKPPTSELGYMVSEGSAHILSSWWWATFPGLVICLIVVSANLFGDFLKDLLDPRIKGGS